MTRTRAAIGICLLGFCMALAFAAERHRSTEAMAQATQAAVMFLQALSHGDSDAARALAWGDTIEINLTPAGLKNFRNLQVIDMLGAVVTSPTNRGEQYDDMHRMVSVSLMVRLLLPDDAGNPPGDYMLFALVVQTDPKADWLVSELGSGP